MHAPNREGDFALVELVMTRSAETEQIRERIFSTLRAENDVVRFQTAISLAAVLARVPIAHQTSQTQILIELGRVLIPTAHKRWIVDPGHIDLYVFDHDGTDWQWKPLRNADHFFHIGLD
jgi:hypothetical protein